MDVGAYVPTNVHFGLGVFDRAGDVGATLGRRPLVVTTRTAMERLGYTGRLLAQLEDHDLQAVVFNEYRTSPTTADVDAGAEQARRWSADCIVALGGGSTIDLAKAVAAVAPRDPPAVDYLYGRATPGPATLPILAIPTTAGSGSETNRSAILADAERPFKDGIRSDHLFPRHALVDPGLTVHAGPALTAQTGFDALAHAIESYVSPKARSFADVLALDAIEAIVRLLPVALREPDHAEARESLARASMTMGVNLTCVGTCLPHRVDKCICGLHPHIPHGQSLAMIYPAWLRRSLSGSRERFARVTELLEGRATREPSADGVAEAMEAFIERVGLAAHPGDLGLATDQIPVLVANVAGDTRVDPVPCEREQLGDFLGAIIEGG